MSTLVRSKVGPWGPVPRWLVVACRPTSVSVFALLGSYADHESDETFVGRPALAEAVGCSVDTIDRALRELREVGAVEVEHRADASGRQTSNTYRLDYNLPRPRPRTSAAAEGRTDAAVEGRASAAGDLDLEERDSDDRKSPSVEGPQRGPQQLPGTELEPAARPRDQVWEAMLQVCGVTSMTAAARGAYNRAAKELREVGATPEQIGQHALVFRERWPEASLTPTALSRRWGECDPGRQHARAPSRREREDREAIQEAADRVYGAMSDPDHDPRSSA